MKHHVYQFKLDLDKCAPHCTGTHYNTGMAIGM